MNHIFLSVNNEVYIRGNTIRNGYAFSSNRYVYVSYRYHVNICSNVSLFINLS